jgi:hypothetical protein
MNVSKKQVVTVSALILLTILLTSVAVSSWPQLEQNTLDVKVIHDLPAKISPGQTQTFSVQINNGSGPFLVRWSYSYLYADGNYSNTFFAGTGLSIPFKLNETCQQVFISATVQDSKGAFGINQIVIEDPEAFTFSSGIYPGASSYTVFVDGTSYKVKDDYGVVSFTSSNAATLFKDLFDVNSHITGDVILMPGFYDVGSTGITVTEASNVHLHGESSGSNFALPNTQPENRNLSTVISGSGCSNILKLIQCVNFKVSGIAFVGNNLCAGGLLSESGHNINVEENYFMGFTSYSIKFIGWGDGSIGGYSGDNWITNNVISVGDDGGGFEVGIGFQGNSSIVGGGGSENTIVSGNQIYSVHNVGIGIKLYAPANGAGSGAGKIDSLVIRDNNIQRMQYGIQIEADDGSIITNNNFEWNGLDIVCSGAYDIRTHFGINKQTYDLPLNVSVTATHFMGEFEPIMTSGRATNVVSGQYILHNMAWDRGVTTNMIVLTCERATVGGQPISVYWNYGIVNATHFQISVVMANGTGLTVPSSVNVQWIAYYFPYRK